MNLPILKKLREAYKIWHGLLKHLPKTSRYTLGSAIDKKFMKIIDLAHLAATSDKAGRKEILKQTSKDLDNLKFWLQVILEMKIVDYKNFGKIASLIIESGKMLGNWIKEVEKTTPSQQIN